MKPQAFKVPYYTTNHLYHNYQNSPLILFQMYRTLYLPISFLKYHYNDPESQSPHLMRFQHIHYHYLISSTSKKPLLDSRSNKSF